MKWPEYNGGLWKDLFHPFPIECVNINFLGSCCWCKNRYLLARVCVSTYKDTFTCKIHIPTICGRKTEWQKQKYLFFLAVIGKRWWCESLFFCNAFPSPTCGVLILSISYVNSFLVFTLNSIKVHHLPKFENTANTGHILVAVQWWKWQHYLFIWGLVNESKGKVGKGCNWLPPASHYIWPLKKESDCKF